LRSPQPAACSLHCLCMPILLTISTVAVTAEDLAKPTERLFAVRNSRSSPY
jgi:hypothetical protein